MFFNNLECDSRNVVSQSLQPLRLKAVMTNNIAKVICFVVISGIAFNSDNVRNEIHIKRYSAKTLRIVMYDFKFSLRKRWGERLLGVI